MYKPKLNPDNSSIIQVLLDIKAAGCPSPSVDDVIDTLQTLPDILEKAEEIYHKHRYPQRALIFAKVSNNIEFARFLSRNALTILTAMYQNMWHRNMIQLSRRDILKITSISSLRPIKPAMEELINKGCIAVAVPGNTRRSPIYMVNPEIATVGKDEKGLQDIFWKYTGTDYKDYQHPVPSEPQKKWISLTSMRTYSKNQSSLDTDMWTIKYNRIGEPKVKTNKKKAAELARIEEQEKLEQEQWEQQAQWEQLDECEQQDLLEQMEMLAQWEQMQQFEQSEQ